MSIEQDLIQSPAGFRQRSHSPAKANNSPSLTSKQYGCLALRPDKGAGGKYLVLGPGDSELEPEGYFVVHSPTVNIWVGQRALEPNREKALATIAAFRVYPYSQRDNPPTTPHLAPNGHLYFQMDKFEDSKKYTQLASDLDPKDPEPYYGIGRIDLKECGSASIPEGRKLGNLPSKNPDQKKACDELHDKNMPFIKEGIDSLDKAIKLRPDYRYAIQLMSQLYLEKAAADCDDPIARTEDLRNWAAWNDKKDFGVSVEARLNSSGDFFEKQLFAGCQSPGAEFSGSGEPYDIAEAYEVYSAIIPLIDPDPKTHMWFIRIDTLSIGKGSSNVGSTGPTGQAREDWKQSHGQTPADTALGDYLKMNTKTWLLQRNFTLPNLYKLVTGDEIKAFSSRGFGEGWIELSAVGFNADRTMAVVYMASHDGKSFLLQKRNGKWEVLGGLSCWVS